MGDIIYKFEDHEKPTIHIKRRVDDHEIQELHFSFHGTPGPDAWIVTETGNRIELFCKDTDGNIVHVDIPISVDDLFNALKRYREE